MRTRGYPARADRRDALPGDHALAELDVRRGEVVVADLETPVEEDAHRETAGAPPTDLGHGAGVARDDRRSIRRRDIDAGVYLGEELRHDAVGRPADPRREH